ncbi:hypothetical protein OTU49_015113 [Cherax quadricarinatus]|uniref:Uncharacterized protein n=1 Tax=Cherax quadricarinatus TaxID=27406 RepID=A0AAW0YAP8_CHEQU|nr:uncharacterized protein DDB_G0283697-like [Cherax quadricarinatus]
MEVRAPKDDDLNQENPSEGGDDKAWMKVSDIPRRFDEMPQEEEEWIPVASIIRAQREETARKEAEQNKIRPPLGLHLNSVPVHQQKPVKKNPEPKKEVTKEMSKNKPPEKNTNLNTELLVEDRKESDEEIDNVTKAMIDWGLKASILYDPGKRRSSTGQLGLKSSPVSPVSNVERFSKISAESYNKNYEAKYSSSHSRDKPEYGHDREGLPSDSYQYHRRRETLPELYGRSHSHENTERRQAFHKDPHYEQRYRENYAHKQWRDIHHDTEPDKDYDYREPKQDYDQDLSRDKDYEYYQEHDGQRQEYRQDYYRYHDSDPYYEEDHDLDHRQEYEHKEHEYNKDDKYGYNNYQGHKNYDQHYHRGHDLGY